MGLGGALPYDLMTVPGAVGLGAVELEDGCRASLEDNLDIFSRWEVLPFFLFLVSGVGKRRILLNLDVLMAFGVNTEFWNQNRGEKAWRESHHSTAVVNDSNFDEISHFN